MCVCVWYTDLLVWLYAYVNTGMHEGHVHMCAGIQMPETDVQCLPQSLYTSFSPLAGVSHCSCWSADDALRGAARVCSSSIEVTNGRCHAWPFTQAPGV